MNFFEKNNRMKYMAKVVYINIYLHMYAYLKKREKFLKDP